MTLVDDWLAEARPASIAAAAERAIAGLVLIDPYSLLAIESLKREHFSDQNAWAVLAAARDLKGKYDLITIGRYLEIGEPVPFGHSGWFSYLCGLQDESWKYDEEYISDHARIVREAAMMRKKEAGRVGV